MELPLRSPGDASGASARIIDAAERRARRFIGFDMADAAAQSGSVISSVMFGALAGADALPFSREAFEAAIRHGGKAIAPNLKGFESGFKRAREGDATRVSEAAPAVPTTEHGRAAAARIASTLPVAAHGIAMEGVRRLMDYQDKAYAGVYLDRLEQFAALDEPDGALTAAAARHLALWMAYEDTIRVADLKIRASRSARVEREVRLAPGQLLAVTEYMHPRLQEVCETMPAPLGRFILRSAGLRGRLEPLFSKGRHVRTTGLRWFLMLRLLAAMRVIRRSTLRYAEEQARIAAWLAFALEVARTDRAAAVEILACQDLVMGYSDTFERSLAAFATVMDTARALHGSPDLSTRLAQIRAQAMTNGLDAVSTCAVASPGVARPA